MHSPDNGIFFEKIGKITQNRSTFKSASFDSTFQGIAAVLNIFPEDFTSLTWAAKKHRQSMVL